MDDKEVAAPMINGRRVEAPKVHDARAKAREFHLQYFCKEKKEKQRLIYLAINEPILAIFDASP